MASKTALETTLFLWPGNFRKEKLGYLLFFVVVVALFFFFSFFLFLPPQKRKKEEADRLVFKLEEEYEKTQKDRHVKSEKKAPSESTEISTAEQVLLPTRPFFLF